MYNYISFTFFRGVLGDRRRNYFWSGSVTDSVVGAFLTQNVSDALSSKAYMEVASRWPAKTIITSNGGDGNSNLPYLDDAADTIDWESVRTVPHAELAEVIKCRGMHTVLSGNIQAFLTHVRNYNLLKKAPNWAGLGASDDDVMVTTEAMLTAIEQCEEENGNIVSPINTEIKVGANGMLTTFEDETAEIPAQPKDHRCCNSSLKRAHMDLAYEEGPISSPSSEVSNTAALATVFKDHILSTSADLLSLEWLRNAPDDEARSFLMNVNGLGRKSVACIMLLTLGKKEFPVDTNVGRICSRLGWIPLDSDDSIEDLDDYAPEPEVHAYLRSRLLGFDIETLYELHYQMITLGKVFCSKVSPNCNACPMRGDCEYAKNNGPSLHGRKKAKTTADVYTPAEFDLAVQQGSVGNTAAEFAAEFLGPGSAQGFKEVGGPTEKDKRVHWRTMQKFKRLEAKREAQALAILEHALRYSTLPLEELILARRTRPRSRGLRRPRGSAVDPIPPLQRTETEFTVLDTALSLQRPYPINWLPLDRMRLEAQGQVLPSVWDACSFEVVQDKGEASALAPRVEEEEDPSEWLMVKEASAKPDFQGGLFPKQREEKKEDNDSMLELQLTSSCFDDMPAVPAVWDLADFPPPPPGPFLPPLEKPTGPPLVLKAKPMVEVSNTPDSGDYVMKVVSSSEFVRNQESAAPVIVPTPPQILPLKAITVEVLRDEIGATPLEFVPEERMMEADLNADKIDISSLPGDEPSTTVIKLVSETATPQPTLPSVAEAMQTENVSAADTASAFGQEVLFNTRERIGEDAEEGPISAVNKTFLPTSPSILLAKAPVLDVEAECRRLQQLALALANVDEAMSTLQEGTDNSEQRKQLLELSLKALNIDLTLTVDSADAVVAAGRRNYRNLARVLHPDKCNHPGAVAAFSALAMAMDIVANYGCTAGAGMEHISKNNVSNNPSEGIATEVDPNATTTGAALCAPAIVSIEHSKVWNQHRLVVSGHILPPHVQASFPHLGRDTIENKTEQVMFVSLENIPTFQRERIAGRFDPGAGVNGSSRQDLETNSTDEVRGVMERLVDAVCENEEELQEAGIFDGEERRSDEFVEGMLLITCRAALRGRFPLNGTYFQINEVFVDHTTATEPIKVSFERCIAKQSALNFLHF